MTPIDTGYDPAAGAYRPECVEDLVGLVGQSLGPSDWVWVSDDLVQSFANTTGDRQWIHVDRERAAASQFGHTIAHGLLTLSLGPWMFEQLLSFEGFAYAVNYGYDRIRFTSPLPVGSRLRLRADVQEVRQGRDSSVVLVTRQHFESDVSSTPVCVADWLLRFTPDPSAGSAP